MSVIIKIIGGFGISIGSVASYIPQFYNIIKYGNVDGISEFSLILMNIGMMCLSMNILIYTWPYFFCFQNLHGDSFNFLGTYLNKLQMNITNYQQRLDPAECLAQFLPFISITLSWLIVLVYYILFIVYRFKKREKKISSLLSYLLAYLCFTLFVIALAVGEKLYHNDQFFIVYANILGVASAVANGLVYIPQIYVMFKRKNAGNVSMLMYFIQTPGNIIIIFLHAFFYHSNISTWITYLIVFIEQFIICIMLVYFKYRRRELDYNEYVR